MNWPPSLALRFNRSPLTLYVNDVMMSETKDWHSVCPLAETVDGDKIAKQCRGHSLLLIRMGSDIFCYEDRCPHAGAPLIDGKISPGRLTCRHHQWQFDLRTGKSLRPVGHQMKSYPVKIENEHVFVRL